jgi:GR25 family glycosyltransferase involved in LPS biosynthesis
VRSPKIHVISLPFRSDRREKIEKKLIDAQIDFTFFSAIDGQRELTKALKVINFSTHSRKYLSPGSIGGIVSHYLLWKEISNSKNNYHIVFEDDTIITPLFLEFYHEGLVIPKDCDILYFGSGSIRSIFTQKKINSKISKLFTVRKGAYAYLLTKGGAAKLLENISGINICCGGIDTILGILTMRQAIMAYHLNPDHCLHDDVSPSNIYNHSKPNKSLHQETQK